MVIASGTRALIAYVEEDTRGVTPTTPTLKTLRLTSERSIDLQADVLESDEVQSHRQISDSRQGFNRVVGSFTSELSRDSHDDPIRFGYGGTWAKVYAQGTFGTDRDTNAITRASGSWIDDGFRPGDVVASRGNTTAANNFTRVRVLSVTALSMVVDFDITVSDTGGGDEMVYLAGGAATGITSAGTFDSVNAAGTFTRASGDWTAEDVEVGDVVSTAGMGQTIGAFVITRVESTTLTVSPRPADNTGGGDEVITILPHGRRIDIGTILRTVTAERQHLDVGLYEPFEGVCWNTLGFSLQPGRLLQLTMSLLGMSASPVDSTSISASPATAAPTTAPFSVFVGELYEGGVALGLVTGLDCELNNNRALQEVLFSKFSPDVFEGRARWTGTLRALFQDRTMLNKFRNETESSVWTLVTDLNASDFINLVWPRVLYNAANLAIPAEGPTIINMPFRATYDGVTRTSAWVQVSNARTT